MNTYDPSEPVVRVVDILSTEVNGQTVLLSIEQQKYFSMGSTSQRVWQLLKAPCTLAQICERLVQEYEIEPQACEREAEIFLRDLWEQRLIRASDTNH